MYRYRETPKPLVGKYETLRRRQTKTIKSIASITSSIFRRYFNIILISPGSRFLLFNPENYHRIQTSRNIEPGQLLKGSKTKIFKWCFEATSENIASSKDRYVAVADPVLAPFDQTHTHHSFTVIMESCCDTLIDANQSWWLLCSKSIWCESNESTGWWIAGMWQLLTLLLLHLTKLRHTIRPLWL
jgi:hypothetical protein